ncbi:hypothetical protein [Agathobaculum sp. Marseille-P7918]|uniref:hypothetical protein n=1 Tax=Agathobaculum sp. Marseille-P7918 TaxID=2479843 RepID=UPI003565CD84
MKTVAVLHCSQKHVQHLEQNGELPANWERAMLFMEKRNIWDATAFGANTQAICYGKWIDSIGTDFCILPRGKAKHLSAADIRTGCNMQAKFDTVLSESASTTGLAGCNTASGLPDDRQGAKKMIPVSLVHLPEETVQAIRWKGVLPQPVSQDYCTPELFDKKKEN